MHAYKCIFEAAVRLRLELMVLGPLSAEKFMPKPKISGFFGIFPGGSRGKCRKIRKFSASAGTFQPKAGPGPSTPNATERPLRIYKYMCIFALFIPPNPEEVAPNEVSCMGDE